MTEIDLAQYGITHSQKIIHNPSYQQLFEDEMNTGLQGYEKGNLTKSGAVNVRTGIFTGRSPKDKYIVKDQTTENTIWWNSKDAPNDNRPISEEVWDDLTSIVCDQLSNKTLYVIDTFCGASKSHRLKIRFIMEVAWQAHFVKNMFIRPSDEELDVYGDPDFVVLNASKTINPNWKKHKLHSEVFTAFNLTEKMQVIGGTWYGGEMKKGIFAIMNYYLPLRNVASMHCAANKGLDDKVSIFFGLSGTGKTTLSTDPKRQLIGDDEHGWDDEGIFNFEGGCYAKTINLDKASEPEIFQAIKRNALLENVVVNNQGDIDFSDNRITENTRVSYPLSHIKNIVTPVSKAGHASTVIFLTADAFGVLPPISKLSEKQIQYYFLSGYTSKLAGTERGVHEPQPTFSACFGKAFLSLHPTQYADILLKRMKQAHSKAYLVNTGWNGKSERISISDTRAIIDAILDGSIERAPTSVLPIFNLEMPIELAHCRSTILDPRDSYDDSLEWYSRAEGLAGRFIKNFDQFIRVDRDTNLVKAGPILFQDEQSKNECTAKKSVFSVKNGLKQVS